MTHPSVNSIVERTAIPSNDADLLMLCTAHPSEAATIISELQAAVQRLTANPADQRYWEGRYRDEAAALSRIKAETIEECARVADRSAELHRGVVASELSMSARSRRFIRAEEADWIASAIRRSLGSTGGAEKTAESGHSPSTHNSESE